MKTLLPAVWCGKIDVQDIARVAIHPRRLQDGPMEAVRMETARRALGRGVRDPAKRAASVAANAVTRIEDGADARPSTIDALRRAIEAAGVLSVTAGDEGPDVGLRRGARPS